jgi:hypothetical protein
MRIDQVLMYEVDVHMRIGPVVCRIGPVLMHEVDRVLMFEDGFSGGV